MRRSAWNMHVRGVATSRTCRRVHWRCLPRAPTPSPGHARECTPTRHDMVLAACQLHQRRPLPQRTLSDRKRMTPSVSSGFSPGASRSAIDSKMNGRTCTWQHTRGGGGMHTNALCWCKTGKQHACAAVHGRHERPAALAGLLLPCARLDAHRVQRVLDGPVAVALNFQQDGVLALALAWRQEAERQGSSTGTAWGMRPCTNYLPNTTTPNPPPRPGWPATQPSPCRRPAPPSLSAVATVEPGCRM